MPAFRLAGSPRAFLELRTARCRALDSRLHDPWLSQVSHVQLGCFVAATAVNCPRHGAWRMEMVELTNHSLVNWSMSTSAQHSLHLHRSTQTVSNVQPSEVVDLL
jgi:hypothetical protein